MSSFPGDLRGSDPLKWPKGLAFLEELFYNRGMSEQESLTPEEIAEEERRLKEAEVQAGEVDVQELAIEQEPIAPIREVQADLLADMGNRFKGKSIEDLQKMLNDPKELDAFGRDSLPGRETQAADVVQNLIRERGESGQEYVTLKAPMAEELTPQQKQDVAWGARFVADEERKQARHQARAEAEAQTAFSAEKKEWGEAPVDALASAREKIRKIDELTEEAKQRTGSQTPRIRIPDELEFTSEELQALEQERLRPEQGEETPEVDAEKTPAETLVEKIGAIKQQVEAAQDRPGSQRYIDLENQRGRLEEALQRQREVYAEAKTKNDARQMSFTAKELERLDGEYLKVEQQIGNLPKEELSGKLESLLHVSLDQQLSEAENQELLTQIQGRKNGRATKEEAALIQDFDRREGERLQQEAYDKGKENFKELLQQKYEVLGEMPKGDQRNKTAVAYAKEAAALGDMRLAQDLLSRCDNPRMREAAVRDLAVTLTEQGIDDPTLLKWVELGIKDKKLRSEAQVDVMNTRQKRELRKQLEQQEVDPKTAEKLLSIIGDMEKKPDMQTADKKWDNMKTALKWGAYGAGGTAVAGAAGLGILAVLAAMFGYLVAFGVVRGIKEGQKGSNSFKFF